ncbi:MAG: transposase family protein, partial [Thermomicrobiales bacterium]
MNASPGGTLHEHCTDLPDPRIERAKRHSLLAIVTIALCGVIGGADSWVEIARVGR